MEDTEILEEGLPENPMPSEDEETPLDKNVKLMSPTRMVLRRFFRSKLSIAGLIMLAVPVLLAGARRVSAVGRNGNGLFGKYYL